jgi:hypothetical protein
LLARFGETEDGQTAGAVAWASVLLPVEDGQGEQILRLVRLAITSEPRSVRHLKTLTAALYRAGQFRAVTAARAKTSSGASDVSAESKLLRAMAQHRLGNVEEAKKWLARAARQIDTRAQVTGQAALLLPLSWDMKLCWRMLRGEATELIEPAAKQQPAQDQSP